MSKPSEQVTRLLHAIERGEAQAADHQLLADDRLPLDALAE